MAVTATFYDSEAVEITALAPLTFGPLNADENEVSAFAAVTVKLPAGKVSTGTWSIDGSGTSDAKFQLSAASDGTGAPAYGAALTGSSAIDSATGVTFYVRAKATSGESAANDTSVTFTITGEAVAV